MDAGWVLDRGWTEHRSFSLATFACNHTCFNGISNLMKKAPQTLYLRGLIENRPNPQLHMLNDNKQDAITILKKHYQSLPF
jgi:hypothetical protein